MLHDGEYENANLLYEQSALFLALENSIVQPFIFRSLSSKFLSLANGIFKIIVDTL